MPALVRRITIWESYIWRSRNILCHRADFVALVKRYRHSSGDPPLKCDHSRHAFQGHKGHRSLHADRSSTYDFMLEIRGDYGGLSRAVSEINDDFGLNS